MKTVADYLLFLESEGSGNTISGGAIETTPTPGKVQKRKVDESDVYEGNNPLANAVGKFPLIDGATAPDMHTTSPGDDTHMFKQKQDQASYTG